ncbi:MAG: cusS [Gammaproteobacteria bacterium]|jgi:two-component system heavy metal sensor histidine kinase CusS|nr:cusS [Gammaproteobacteria bacterium]
MLWKHVKRFRWQSLSLVTKLMILYSLSTLGLLAAITVFLYPTWLKVMEQMQSTDLLFISAECHRKLIIVLLLSSFVTIFLGYWVARTGLNRMREFANSMEKMSAQSLHERIDPKEWPSELNLLINKFNALLNRLHTSFVQLSQFSSDIAHELRTPLQNLMCMTEISLSQNNLSEPCQQLLEKHMQEYYFLSKLIENLLFLARSDQKQLLLQKEKVAIHEEIRSLFDYYQGIAEEKNIQLSCEGQALVYADSLLLKRAFSNVISNSLKYTPENGSISVQIQVCSLWVTVSITDTGIGIPEEHLLKICDRFYRVDQSRSRNSGGFGLGLALVKSIIELNQGSVLISSPDQKGTCVSLKLPA